MVLVPPTIWIPIYPRTSQLSHPVSQHPYSPSLVSKWKDTHSIDVEEPLHPLRDERWFISQREACKPLLCFPGTHRYRPKFTAGVRVLLPLVESPLLFLWRPGHLSRLFHIRHDSHKQLALQRESLIDHDRDAHSRILPILYG